MLRAFLSSLLLLLLAVAATAAEPSAALTATGPASKTTPATAPAPATAARESELAKAIEKQERRHFEMHRFYIPLTQGNLQWLAATIGASPGEAALVWKLMRGWDGARWTSVVSRNPS